MPSISFGRGWTVWLLALVSLGAAGPSGGTAGPQDALVEAVRGADAAAVRALLHQEVDVNAVGPDGTTALHWAVHRDDLEMADLLIGAGANVRAANRYGVEPLSLASVNGSAAMLEKLLVAGADPNTTRPGGETALMTAARTGKADALQVLLEHGADVHARESWKQQSALMWAAAENNAEAVEVLIEAGADVSARSQVSGPLSSYEVGNSGFTALLFAARAGAMDAVGVLLGAGADVNDTLVDDGTSALVLAVMTARYDMAEFLLDQGADPNAAAQGWTALHQVAYTRRPNKGLNQIAPVARGGVDSLSLVRKLAAHGADLNARMTQEMTTLYSGRNNLNRIGGTPFFLAAVRFDLELMRTLVALGADPLLANVDETTPLMVAAGVGMHNLGANPGTSEEVVEAVTLALELGGVPTVNLLGETPLHGIARTGANAAVQMLIDAGARLEVKDDRGNTAFNVANGLSDGLFKAWPETAALLRTMMEARGLPVEDSRGPAATIPGVAGAVETPPDGGRR